VILLGVIERRGVEDLRGDPPVARPRERALVDVAEGLRPPPLLGCGDAD
jgi:hypothetical protein